MIPTPKAELTKPALPTCGENRVVLRGVTYQAYKLLLEQTGDTAGRRIAYDGENLEIVTPTFDHETIARLFHYLVLIICEEWDWDFRDFGTATYRRDDLERGFEPDASFYLQNVGKVLENRELDLERDPPPDLILEVDISSPSLNKLPLYAKLGISELWLHRNARLIIMALQGDGSYSPKTQSRAIPGLTDAIVNDLIVIAPTMRRPQWTRHVRQWAADNKPVGTVPY